MAALQVSSGTQTPMILPTILVQTFHYQVNSWFQMADGAPAIKPMFYKCWVKRVDTWEYILYDLSYMELIKKTFIVIKVKIVVIFMWSHWLGGATREPSGVLEWFISLFGLCYRHMNNFLICANLRSVYFTKSKIID